MADEPEFRPEDQSPEASGRGNGGESGAGGVNRRALIGGGAGVVAAGVVVAGIATDWFSGSDNGAPKVPAADTRTVTQEAPTGITRVGDAPPPNTPGLPVVNSYVPPNAQRYTISVNGSDHNIEVAPDTMLLYVLRDQLNLHGPKFGCGLAECGACAVLSDGVQIRSCITPISSVGTREITTLEGLAATYNGPTARTDPDGKLHPLQQAWIDEQVPQCGYCQSGMIIQAADLLSTNRNPTDDEIRTNMDGHLCRCGTHFRILRAIRSAADVMSGGTSS